MQLRRIFIFAGLAIAGLTVLPCQASTIQVGINGDAQVGSNYIEFGQYPNGAPYAPAPGYGTFEVSLVKSGLFSAAGITTGEFGKIQSLNEGTGAITLPGPFMTFNTGGSNLQLWATNLPAGVAGPFVFTETSDGAVASFNLEGYIWDTNSGKEIDTYSGTFSATFDGESVAQLMTSLPDDTPFAATFVAVATPVSSSPEPATLILMGTGLALMGLFGRGRRRQTRSESI